MSPSLQGEVAIRCNERWLKRVWYLVHTEEEFLVQVALHLSAMVFAPGELVAPMSVPFEFKDVQLPYETYQGINVRLRYAVRVTMQRSYGNTVAQEFRFLVRNAGIPPQLDGPGIKMEVGIEDCLHIEFEYNKSKYHLKDAVLGKIFFLLVRIKIKHMEVAIIKRESTGSGANT